MSRGRGGGDRRRRGHRPQGKVGLRSWRPSARAVLVPPLSASAHILGAYRIQNAELLSIGAYTNTAPTGPYRGSGRPEGVYLIERLMDEAARVTRPRSGRDPPAQLHSHPTRFPYRTRVRRRLRLRRATPERSIAWWSWRTTPACAASRPSGARARRDRRDWASRPTSNPPTCWAGRAASSASSGPAKVTAVTGSSPHGQGHETTFAQIIADHLGVAHEDVIVRHGDTLGAPAGDRHVRQPQRRASAAAPWRRPRPRSGRRAAGLAARLLEASPEDFSPCAAAFRSMGVPGAPGQLGARRRIRASRDGAAAGGDPRARGDRVLSPGPARRGASAPARRRPGRPRYRPGFAWSAFFAVDDCGNAINPLLVDGQIVGGLPRGSARRCLEHDRLRRGRPAPDRHVHGVCDPACGRHAGAGGRSHRDADRRSTR